MNYFGVLLCLALLTGCQRPAATPHYELGHAYSVRGVWFYPGENFTFDDTGLAAVYGAGHAPLTSDGEVFDPSIVMAGHPTLQLPAVARLTNLENGRSIVVRLNDRGTGNPGRLVDVTRRTAALLGMPDAGGTRVRLQVLADDSHAAADGLPGHPQIAITAAPRASVVATDLPPLAGVGAEPNKVRPVTAPVATVDAPVVIARPPETVTQGVPNPGRLWVRLDAFEEYQYAAAQRARMNDLGASIEPVFEGRVRRFRVQIGPLDTVPQAERALNDALARGIPDAHIVVD